MTPPAGMDRGEKAGWWAVGILFAICAVIGVLSADLSAFLGWIAVALVTAAPLGACVATFIRE